MSRTTAARALSNASNCVSMASTRSRSAPSSVSKRSGTGGSRRRPLVHLAGRKPQDEAHGDDEHHRRRENLIVIQQALLPQPDQDDHGGGGEPVEAGAIFLHDHAAPVELHAPQSRREA